MIWIRYYRPRDSKRMTVTMCIFERKIDFQEMWRRSLSPSKSTTRKNGTSSWTATNPRHSRRWAHRFQRSSWIRFTKWTKDTSRLGSGMQRMVRAFNLHKQQERASCNRYRVVSARKMGTSTSWSRHLRRLKINEENNSMRCTSKVLIAIRITICQRVNLPRGRSCCLPQIGKKDNKS